MGVSLTSLPPRAAGGAPPAGGSSFGGCCCAAPHSSNAASSQDTEQRAAQHGVFHPESIRLKCKVELPPPALVPSQQRLLT